MPIDSRWMKYSDYLQIEAIQGMDEGKDTTVYSGRVEEIRALPENDAQRETLARELLTKLQELPASGSGRYHEPDDLEGIRAARPGEGISACSKEVPFDSQALFDKIYGAWLGRCAGCLLGQPVEGWKRARITGLLQETGNYPVQYYISSDIGNALRAKYDVKDEVWAYGSRKKSWINNISHAPEDDDTNYTLLGLRILEEYGMDFTPDDVAESWLRYLPVHSTCTAERVAYRNLVNGILPPYSAKHLNPYREWIGAQIRADIFGYVTPGRPELGAGLAWRDASISHVKNGIYGEMFIAAMLSQAFVTNDIKSIILCGLEQIPKASRLAGEVLEVLTWKGQDVTWEEAIGRIHQRYDENKGHHWCHTISNALIVCLALLYGGLDFENTVGIAVAAGFDTDCNAATAGSVVGLTAGANALPEKWVRPLNDRLLSGVDGLGLVRISEMAARTVDVIKKAGL